MQQHNACEMPPRNAIVGAGLSGLLLSFVLQKLGVPFSLFDRSGEKKLVQRASVDRRLISLSALNALFLKDVIDCSKGYPVKRVDFSVNNTHVYTHTSPDPISYLFFYEDLYACLWEQVTRFNAVIACAPPLNRHKNMWHLFDENPPQAPRIFACDGKASTMRKTLGMRVLDSNIRQCAFVGRVTFDGHHKQAAFECFLPQGVLTLLPEEPGVFSFIWHVRAPMEKVLTSLSEKDIVALMQKYIPRVKLLSLLGQYDTYNVAPACAEHFCADNVYLCGDAAHSLHPLSGQSLNVYIEALRGLDAHYSQDFDYQKWSNIYAKQARTMFHVTTFLDRFFCSHRLLSLKQKLFGLGSALGMTQFCADYILGGMNSLDRTRRFATLSDDKMFNADLFDGH